MSHMDYQIFEDCMKEKSEPSRGSNKNYAFVSGSSLIFHYGTFIFYDHSSMTRQHTLYQKAQLRLTANIPSITQLCLMIIQASFHSLCCHRALSQYTVLIMKAT